MYFCPHAQLSIIPQTHWRKELRTDSFVSSALRLLPVFHEGHILQLHTVLNRPTESKAWGGPANVSRLQDFFFLCVSHSITVASRKYRWLQAFIFLKTRENKSNKVLHQSLSAFSPCFIETIHFAIYCFHCWSQGLGPPFALFCHLPSAPWSWGERTERCYSEDGILSSSWSSSSSSSLYTLLLQEQSST